MSDRCNTPFYDSDSLAPWLFNGTKKWVGFTSRASHRFCNEMYNSGK
jgi:hypothetical protein